ncbi:MAG: glycoside hydrolase 43 family protein [Sedimentisphaerales bacterium]|nr:glycoside hydrolase 43 family protein [Sedimentisphaerales bacterium]
MNNNIVWQPDNEDGTYKNPVIFADYSDPDVIRVGDDFYMTASSFNCVPGLPILHSKDLVNWKIIGHAIQRFEDERFDLPQHGNGIWAPAIRYHDGWFWIFVGDPDAGILMTKAKNPAGPWEPLHLVQEGKGLIDTCPLWDDDGNAYLVHAWANSRAGINSILTLRRMSPDGKKLLDEGTLVYDGRNGVAPTIEGPKFYKRNGWYYIFAPAGGVREGWQLALRSKNVFGPYEAKRVLEQGGTNINGPHQGGWVELENGENWFVHFQERDAYGRVVHLNPVSWVDDWPLMGIDSDGNGVGEPVSRYKKPDVGKTYPVEVPQTSDDFDSQKLGLQWQWHANPKDNWASLTTKPGWMRLFAVPEPAGFKSLWSVPNLILQKLPAPEFTVTARLDCTGLVEGNKTGMLVMGRSYSYLAVEKTSSGLRLIRKTCRDADRNGREVEEAGEDFASDTLLLRVEVTDDEICHFSYSENGINFKSIGDAFKAREGRWIGAKVGLFCLAGNERQTAGYADFDWFVFE